jgi:hypothetical protein
MRDTPYWRVVQIGMILGGATLLVTLAMVVLYWLLVPEFSLATLIDCIRPYVPLRYAALAFTASSL